MGVDDSDIDQLARDIERAIARAEDRLDKAEDFSPRSNRSRKMQRMLGKSP